MNTSPVAEYIQSTAEDSKVRRKLAKAIKRLRHIRDEDLSHAQEDLEHAKKDLGEALAAFEHLMEDFRHAIADVADAGRDVAHAREDHNHAEEDFEKGEEILLHAVKDFRHALKDFSHALKDLEQIDDIAELIAETAAAAGKPEITAELVRLHVAEEAGKDRSMGEPAS